MEVHARQYMPTHVETSWKALGTQPDEAETSITHSTRARRIIMEPRGLFRDYVYMPDENVKFYVSNS